MSNCSDEPCLEPGDPWLYLEQKLEYEAARSESSESEYSTIVVGVRYHDQTSYESLKDGVRLRLAPEPDNEFDANAVAVFSENTRKLGYLPREDAAVVVASIREQHIEEIFATFRSGRLYIKEIPSKKRSTSACAVSSSAKLVDIDDLGDFEVAGDEQDSHLKNEKKRSIGSDCWAGFHKSMGPVICDPSKCFNGSKYAFRVWCSQQNAFVPVDRIQLDSELVPLHMLDIKQLGDLKYAVNQYNSSSGTSGSLYWHGTPGLLNPIVSTGEMFLDKRIADTPWDL